MINDLNIGPLTIHLYGVMVAIGYMSALLISEKRAKKRGLDPDILFGIFWCAVLGGAAGSKILYFTVSFKDILKDPSILWNFQNGWVVYGGIIGGILTGWGYCRYKKVDFLSYLDLVLPAVAFAQGCGRIGCFFAGCCYGRETDSFFSIKYWQSDYAPNGISCSIPWVQRLQRVFRTSFQPSLTPPASASLPCPLASSEAPFWTNRRPATRPSW